MHFVIVAVPTQVVEMLACAPAASSTDRRAQTLLGHPVCQHAFRKLLNLGSSRYYRLKAAAAAGERAPLDARFQPQESKFDSRHQRYLAKRELIVEFLEELYQTVSEPMPEANQHSTRKAAETNSAKKTGSKKDSKSHAVVEDRSHPMKFRRHRGRRPKLAAQWHRGEDKSEMRLLPPGSFSDYLAVLVARHPGVKFSLKLFAKVAWIYLMQSFCNTL